MAPRFVLALLLIPATLCGCPPSQPHAAPRHARVEVAPALVLAPPDAPTRHLVADAAEP